MVMHVLLFKNTKGVFPIEGFRLEVYLREFTRHCVILVLFRVFLYMRKICILTMIKGYNIWNQATMLSVWICATG